MKSTMYQQQKNNFKKVNQIILIPLGILATLFSNSALANEKSNLVVNPSKIVLVAPSNTILFKKPALAIASDTILVTEGYTKTIEEVIKEDKLIIESTITNEVFPLDFDKLYKATPKGSKAKRQNSLSRKSSIKS